MSFLRSERLRTQSLSGDVAIRSYFRGFYQVL